MVDKVTTAKRKEKKFSCRRTGQIRRNDDRLPLETLHRRRVVDRVTGAELETPSLSDETVMKERRTSVWKLLMEGEWMRRGELRCLEASTFGK